MMKRNQITQAVAGVLLLLLALLSRGAAQSAPTEALTFSPVADSWVSSDAPTANYDAEARLRIDGSAIRIAYLRFRVAGVNGRPIERARPRLGVSAGSSGGGTVHRITDSTWDETTLTWNNHPAVDGPGLSTLGAAAPRPRVPRLTARSTVRADCSRSRAGS